jgi:hypothetical protein
MKKLNNSILLYIIIVLIPAILLTVYFSNEIYDKNLKICKNHAKWIATIHVEQWNNFIRSGWKCYNRF